MTEIGQSAQSYRTAYEVWDTITNFQETDPLLGASLEEERLQQLTLMGALDEGAFADLKAVLEPAENPGYYQTVARVEALRNSAAYTQGIIDEVKIQELLGAIPQPEEYDGPDIAFANAFFVGRVLSSAHTLIELVDTVPLVLSVEQEPKEVQGVSETTEALDAHLTIDSDGKEVEGVNDSVGEINPENIANVLKIKSTSKLKRVLELLINATPERPVRPGDLKEAGIYTTTELKKLVHGTKQLAINAAEIRKRIDNLNLEHRIILHTVQLDGQTRYTTRRKTDRDSRTGYAIEIRDAQPDPQEQQVVTDEHSQLKQPELEGGAIAAEADVNTDLVDVSEINESENECEFTIARASMLACMMNIKSELLKELGLPVIDPELVNQLVDHLTEDEQFSDLTDDDINTQRALAYNLVNSYFIGSEKIKSSINALPNNDPRTDFILYLIDIFNSGKQELLEGVLNAVPDPLYSLGISGEKQDLIGVRYHVLIEGSMTEIVIGNSSLSDAVIDHYTQPAVVEDEQDEASQNSVEGADISTEPVELTEGVVVDLVHQAQAAEVQDETRFDNQKRITELEKALPEVNTIIDNVLTELVSFGVKSASGTVNLGQAISLKSTRIARKDFQNFNAKRTSGSGSGVKKSKNGQLTVADVLQITLQHRLQGKYQKHKNAVEAIIKDRLSSFNQ